MKKAKKNSTLTSPWEQLCVYLVAMQMHNKRIKPAHFVRSTRNPLRALLAAYSRR